MEHDEENANIYDDNFYSKETVHSANNFVPSSDTEGVPAPVARPDINAIICDSEKEYDSGIQSPEITSISTQIDTEFYDENNSSLLIELQFQTDTLHEKMLNIIKFLNQNPTLSTSKIYYLLERTDPSKKIYDNKDKVIAPYKDFDLCIREKSSLNQNEVDTTKSIYNEIVSTNLNEMVPVVDKIKHLVNVLTNNINNKSQQISESLNRNTRVPDIPTQAVDTYEKLFQRNKQTNDVTKQEPNEHEFNDVKKLHDLNYLINIPEKDKVNRMKEKYDYNKDLNCYDKQESANVDKRTVLLSDFDKLNFIETSEIKGEHSKNQQSINFGKQAVLSGVIDNNNFPETTKRPSKRESSKETQVKIGLVDEKPNSKDTFSKQKEFNYSKYLSTLKHVVNPNPSPETQIQFLKNDNFSEHFDFMNYYAKIIDLRQKHTQLKKYSLNESTLVSKEFFSPSNQCIKVHDSSFQTEVQDKFCTDFEKFFEQIKSNQTNKSGIKCETLSSGENSSESVTLSRTPDVHKSNLPISAKKTRNRNSDQCQIINRSDKNNLPEHKMRIDSPIPVKETFRKLVYMLSPSRYFK